MYGGLVSRIFEEDKKIEVSVVRFSFSFAVREEMKDLSSDRLEEKETLLKVLRESNSQKYQKIRLIGRSFGAVVAAEYLSDLSFEEQQKYELVVLGYDLGLINLEKVFCKITIIQGALDRFGNGNAVKEDLKGDVPGKAKLIQVGGANHGFCDPLTGEGVYFDVVIKLLFSFSTVEKEKGKRAAKRKEEIHNVVQRYDFDCGWGAVSTILLMIRREDVLKTDLFGRLGVNPLDGTKSQNIKKLFEEENIRYVESWGTSIEQVRTNLLYGKVCLVCYQAWGSLEEMEKLDSGHYSVIFDIDDQYVWLLDPAVDEEDVPGAGMGVVRKEIGEFDKWWIDKGLEGEIYDHWMIAVDCD